MPCSSNLRIGIFGGAFDPPHRGHEKAVLAFLEKAKLDLLYVIPSGKPPHKVISGGAEDADRLAMASLAFLPLSDKIRISDSEVLDRGTCYSYLTVERVRALHPDSEIFLFIGTDQFLAFETWRKFEYILQTCTLCVMDRFEDFSWLDEKKALLEKNFGARVLLLQEKPYIISSTDIRRELGEKGFSRALSPAVNEYITEKGIYSALSDPVRGKLLERAKKALSPHRFSHTLSVEREAVRIAELLSLSQEDVKDLSLASIYHDLAKNMTDEALCSFLIYIGESVSEEDRASPAVLHGRASAQMAAEDGLVSEEGILAIRYHTTGRAGMTLKEKILYFADYTEETRTHTACREMRKHFYENLPDETEERIRFFDRCVLTVMENVARYLKEKQIPCHSLGEEALLDLKQKID